MPTPLRSSPPVVAHHAFRGLEDWIEVFRAGTHVDSQGVTCTFTGEDLDEMVRNEALGRPPAVLGHPKHDDPAYGWATLRRDGDSLFARFDEVHPAFASGVASGAYRNRSVAIVRDARHGWRVRHIGWLGAAPPAIDGLKPVQFNASVGLQEHCFSAPEDLALSWALGDIAGLMRALREWLIAKDGLEAANAALPDYRIESISSAAARLREDAMADANPTFHAQPTGAPAMSLTPDDLQRAADEAAARATAETEARFAAQAEELKRLRSERQAERIRAQIKTWRDAGVLPPAQEPGLAEFMAALETSAAVEFQFSAPSAEAGRPAQDIKRTPAAYFAEFMAARSPVVRLGVRQALDDPAPPATRSDAQIASEAREYMAAEASRGRRISLGEALDHVSANPGNTPAARG